MNNIKNFSQYSSEVTYIFCDGACSGNPGPGGWAAIILKNSKVKEIAGFQLHTTNNQMEMIAAIEAIKQAASSQIKIYTDSSYLISGITQWIPNWIKNNWMTASKKPVKNIDLWKQLMAQTEGKSIQWKHVLGHSGVSGNERADQIAVSACRLQNQFLGQKLYEGLIKDYPVPLLPLP